MTHQISVAPMMGCTDRHCRYLLRLLSPNSLLYSEMITSSALIHGDRDLMLAHRPDHASAFQLGGGDPAELAVAARYVEEAGYQEVNLNCGCPSDRVQQGSIGACLMAEPNRVADCWQAMSEAVSIPVTIKTRIGIDDSDSFEFFSRFIETIYTAGCRQFQIHARKAILQGLSPKENREIPPLNYDFVRDIQQLFPNAVFVLNGGISSVSQAVELLKGFPGVMLGRAPYSNPYLLAELEQAINQRPLPDRLDIVAAYRSYMEQEIARGCHIKHMAKHLLGLFTGLPGARAFRRSLSTTMYDDEAGIEVIDLALETMQTTAQKARATSNSSIREVAHSD